MTCGFMLSNFGKICGYEIRKATKSYERHFPLSQLFVFRVFRPFSYFVPISYFAYFVLFRISYPVSVSSCLLMQTPKRYTVTAALIYANGPIHIGHLAGCYLPSD